MVSAAVCVVYACMFSSLPFCFVVQGLTYFELVFQNCMYTRIHVYDTELTSFQSLAAEKRAGIGGLRVHISAVFLPWLQGCPP